MFDYLRKNAAKYKEIREEIYRQNREMYIRLVATGLCVSGAIDIANAVLSSSMPVLIVNLLLFLYFILLFIFKKQVLALYERKPGIRLMYMLCAIPLTLALIKDACLMPDADSFVFFVFILILPLFLFDTPIYVFAFVTTYILVFLFCDWLFCTYEIFMTDMVHGLVCWLASISMSMSMLNIKTRSAELYLQSVKRSEHHTVSGLKNLYAFEREMSIYYDSTVNLLAIDLDDFKFFNETYGHEAGDEIISKFAEVLRETFGAEYCYSWGGDEFLIAAFETGDRLIEEQVKLLRERTREMEIGGRKIRPKFTSACIMGECDGEDSLKEMIEAARQLLGIAKAEKKGTSVFRTMDQFRIDLAEREGTVISPDMKDHLTGLLNVKAFTAQAELAVESTVDLESDPIVVYFNISNFRSFNQSFGFFEGNTLLRHVADILRTEFPGMRIGRFGEDHFVVFTYAENIMDRLESANRRFQDYANGVNMRLCAGIYRYKEGTRVDFACDCAKAACDSIRDNAERVYRWFDEDLERVVSMQQHVLNHFHEAMREGWIQPYYQPVVRAINGRVASFEALARWNDPVYGNISPADFISILERRHLIDQLDMYIVEKVCEGFTTRERSGRNIVPVSVNISRQDLENGDIAAKILDIADRTNVDYRNIVIEVTESIADADHDMIRAFIKKFHDVGMEVWLDGFGSGYASFDILKEFDFDTVKLDMRFLEDFSPNSKSSYIIEEVSDLIQRVGMHSLIEGVETEEQVRFLRNVGIELLQGYYYSKPVPLSGLGGQLGKGRLLSTETSREREYYNNLGAISPYSPNALGLTPKAQTLIDSLPAAIVEFDPNQHKIYTMRTTPACRRLMAIGELNFERLERDDLIELLEECNKKMGWAHIKRDFTDLGTAYVNICKIGENPDTGSIAYYILVGDRQ
ncbi:MAG: bifunctional diguanylate cyclase/phosphodiesterase [Anaerovoracaceae bacterium]|jgi:diguanylate cyclase (GGDEF)-like protein